MVREEGRATEKKKERAENRVIIFILYFFGQSRELSQWGREREREKRERERERATLEGERAIINYWSQPSSHSVGQ